MLDCSSMVSTLHAAVCTMLQNPAWHQNCTRSMIDTAMLWLVGMY